MNTLLEFILHMDPKNSTARDTKLYMLIYDERLVSDTYVLGCKASPVRDAKLKLLMHFKMHYNLRL